MLDIDTKLEGKLFSSSPARLKKQIEEGIPKATIKYARTVVQPRTPVRTGALKADWKPLGSQLHNSLHYASYIEYGTPRMYARAPLTRSLPQIEQKLVELGEKALQNFTD